MEKILIHESTYKKRYKCKYCDERYERDKLIKHIDINHADMIPDQYTASRIAFNIINKKEYGRCVQCGKKTEWNENNLRYDRYCSEKCKNEYVKIAKDRMKKVYGKEYILDDPDHQNKMLSGRSISGVYKSSKGESFTYVGSYEKNLLIFLDTVMEFTSKDIITPGPVINYFHNGKKHFWITDLYIVPFNLVIDVKDGGSNPNTRDMKEYREKQNAKEKAISELGTFNYIRLTDNQFDQLWAAMVEIKYSMIDSNFKNTRVIKINEDTYFELEDNHISSITIEQVLTPPGKGPITVVPYISNVSEEDIRFDYCIGQSRDKNLMFRYDAEKKSFRKVDYNDIKENTMYQYDNPEKTEVNGTFTPSNILEAITGRKILYPDQLLYDNHFSIIESFQDHIDNACECLEATILSNNEFILPEIDSVLEDVEVYSDNNGVFIKNPYNNLRSKSYNSTDQISDDIKKIISSGKL